MVIEIGMPVYRPSKRLEAVLTALAVQTYKNFIVTIYNDTPPSEILEIRQDEQIVEKMRNKYGMNIRLIQNKCNLGYMKNVHQIFDNASGDILFLLADDDIISYDCLELLVKAFADEDVGCVSRPYYWFIDDFRKAVRFEGSIYKNIQKVSLLDSSVERVGECISATGQLSGLGFRMSILRSSDGYPFVEDMFTSHVYPFLYTFSKSKCAYMPRPTVAVSTSTSQCQNDIYDPSPMEQWIRLFETVLRDSKYERKRKELIECQVTTDFVGLAQIKNYGTFSELLLEIRNYVKYRKKNLVNPKFYFFSIGSIIIPKFLLKRLINWYKKRIIFWKVKRIRIEYDRFPFNDIDSVWSFPIENERN